MEQINTLLTRLNENKGQVVVEYLLLLSLAFITAWVIMTVGPLPNFATKMLGDVSSRLGNVVRNAEMEKGEFETGTAGHPSHPKRLKALHL